MIDYGSVKQVIEEFDKKHGSDCVCWNGWLLYSDGATRERNPLGALCDVPRDPQEAARLKLKFVEIRTQLARDEFNNLKNNLQSHCQVLVSQGVCSNPLSPPSASTVASLKELRKKVLLWQGKLTAARKNLEANKPEYLKQQEKACELNRQKNAEIMSEIESIKI